MYTFIKIVNSVSKNDITIKMSTGALTLIGSA